MIEMSIRFCDGIRDTNKADSINDLLITLAKYTGHPRFQDIWYSLLDKCKIIESQEDATEEELTSIAALKCIMPSLMNWSGFLTTLHDSSTSTDKEDDDSRKEKELFDIFKTRLSNGVAIFISNKSSSDCVSLPLRLFLCYTEIFLLIEEEEDWHPSSPKNDNEQSHDEKSEPNDKRLARPRRRRRNGQNIWRK